MLWQGKTSSTNAVMKLQTKITLCILPLVVSAILLVGVLSIRIADKAIHQTVYNHMYTTLELFVENVVRDHYLLLVKNGLDQVPSYIEEYQNHVMKTAAGFTVAEGGHIFALDRAGRFVFCNVGMEESAIQDLWSATAVQIAAGTDAPAKGFLSGVDSDHVYVAQYFEPWQWVLFYAFSDNDFKIFKQPIHSAAFVVAGICALLLTLLILLVFRLFFVKPVNTLMGAAAAIAKGDRIHEIPVRTRDELGALSRSMERMAESITAFRKRQDNWKRRLEREVEARTRDLKETNEALMGEIEERENTENSLVASEERYRQLFSTMMHGFAVHEIICNDQGVPVDYRFLEMNPAFEDQTGMNRKEVVGKRILEVLPDLEPEWVERFGKVALTGDSIRFEQFSTQLGKHFDVMAYSPKPGQFATLFSDVTERVTLETGLRQAQKMESIGALAGGIAHDFNNILFPIIGYAEMSLDEIPETNAFIRENLNQVLAGADRAKKLVQQILTFSRQTEHQVHPIRLEPVLKESIKLLQATLPATIEVVLKIEPNSGEILGDPTQVHQIMMNLCTNAYHAMMERGGVLTVEMKSVFIPEEGDLVPKGLNPGAYLRLSIEDTGHGIDGVDIERIFDPYFTTKPQGKGTGLGLSVVHGIVRSYGGDISVESDPGKGTRFEVYFPALKAAETEKEISSEGPVPTGSECILLVDDEAPIAGMMRQMLERLGYRVTACLSSQDALDLFTHDPDRFDLLITDLTMPKMTGIELAERIIALVPDKPIILCTGFSDIISEADARKIGIREYVLKPIIRTDLAKAIRRALGESFAG